MKISSLAAALLVGSLLGACATPYQPRGASGGFVESWRAQNEVVITFSGNGFSDRVAVEEMTLLRASELARQNGFTHFVVLAQGDASSSFAWTDPTRTTTTGNYTRSTGAVQLQSRTTGGDTTVVNKPGTAMRVMFTNNPGAAQSTLSAEFIYRQFAPKYMRR